MPCLPASVHPHDDLSRGANQPKTNPPAKYPAEERLALVCTAAVAITAMLNLLMLQQQSVAMACTVNQEETAIRHPNQKV